jgi:hypothetical protein
MEKLRVGILGSRFSAHLHLSSYGKLRGNKMGAVTVAVKHSLKNLSTEPFTEFHDTLLVTQGAEVFPFIGKCQEIFLNAITTHGQIHFAGYHNQDSGESSIAHWGGE